MPIRLPKPSVLLLELKRRRVIGTLIYYTYGYVALLAAVDVLVKSLGIPPWVQSLVAWSGLAGLPITAVLAWLFEWTAEGIRRTPGPDGESSHGGWHPLRWALLAVALPFAVWLIWRLFPKPPEPTPFARSVDQPVATPPTISATTSVAILEFRDESRGLEDPWLAGAVRDRLMEDLSGSPRLQVHSNEYIDGFLARGLPRDSLRGLLDLGYFIEGVADLSATGADLRVLLVDASRGTVIRTFQATRTADVPQTRLVSDLSRDIIERLLPALGSELRRLGVAASQPDALAYEKYHAADAHISRGRLLVQRNQFTAALRAYDDAERLLAWSQSLDPDWIEPALARSRLAETRVLAQLQSGVQPAGAGNPLSEAVARLDTALERYPGDARALALRGRLRWRSYALFAPGGESTVELLSAAERDLRESLELDPALASAAAVLSELLRDRNEFAEAFGFAQLAWELDAFAEDAAMVIYNLGTSEFELGNDRNAIEWCREGVRRYPDEARFHSCLLDVMAWGALPADPDSAWAHYDRIRELEPGTANTVYYGMAVAGALARAGDPDSARAVMARVKASANSDATDGLADEDAWCEAGVRGRMGDIDAARDLLLRFRRDYPARALLIFGRRVVKPFAPALLVG